FFHVISNHPQCFPFSKPRRINISSLPSPLYYFLTITLATAGPKAPASGIGSFIVKSLLLKEGKQYSTLLTGGLVTLSTRGGLFLLSRGERIYRFWGWRK
ncbi:hypothetical protein Pfo_012542, partial [Paulownia fortunei]